MAAIGGPIESISLDGRNFAVSADTDSNRARGGDNNEVAMNGDGTARIIKTLMPWSVEGLNLEVDDSRGDQEFVQDLADRNDFFPITAIYASGEIWQGTGQVTGELKASSANAIMPINLAGTGKFSQQ